MSPSSTEGRNEVEAQTGVRLCLLARSDGRREVEVAVLCAGLSLSTKTSGSDNGPGLVPGPL